MTQGAHHQPPDHRMFPRKIVVFLVVVVAWSLFIFYVLMTEASGHNRLPARIEVLVRELLSIAAVIVAFALMVVPTLRRMVDLVDDIAKDQAKPPPPPAQRHPDPERTMPVMPSPAISPLIAKPVAVGASPPQGQGALYGSVVAAASRPTSALPRGDEDNNTEANDLDSQVDGVIRRLQGEGGR